MPFSYYARLSAGNKRIYDASERIIALQLQSAAELWVCVSALEVALESTQLAAVQQACQVLADGLCSQLQAPPVAVKVLAKRPSNRYGELHGLYEGVEIGGDTTGLITYMRTDGITIVSEAVGEARVGIRKL